MKKTIAILLVLVLAGVGLFAAPDPVVQDNSKDLILNTSISGRYEVKVSSDTITTTNLGTKLSTFRDLTEVGSVTFGYDTGEVLTKALYISYLTNQKIKAIVEVTATPMINSNTTSIIGYTVTGGLETPVTIDATNLSQTIKFFEEADILNGMRVFSKSIGIAMIEDDWIAATGDLAYSTTWTISLTSN